MLRKLKGGYLLWVVANMTMAIFNAENLFGEGFEAEFFPFARSYQGRYSLIYKWYHVYDWTEFLFYTIVPVLIYYAIVLLRPQPEPKEDE